jgi:CBS domain-containing protein
MSKSVTSCRPNENLASLANLMWQGDCGAVPVVDDDQIPIGIVTDRDAFIALATRFRAPGEIPVQEVMTPSPVTCRSDEDVFLVMKRMGEHQVRRLPVVDPGGALVGMISLSDLAARSTAKPSLIDAELAVTLQAISRSHREVPQLALDGHLIVTS